MTTEIESSAAKADRYVKAAKATISTLSGRALSAHELEQHQREIELALDAAQVYSRLAIAEAVERSFPGLDVVEDGVLGFPVLDAARQEELAGCPHVHCRMQVGGSL